MPVSKHRKKLPKKTKSSNRCILCNKKSVIKAFFKPFNSEKAMKYYLCEFHILKSSQEQAAEIEDILLGTAL